MVIEDGLVGDVEQKAPYGVGFVCGCWGEVVVGEGGAADDELRPMFEFDVNWCRPLQVSNISNLTLVEI